jgi:hypothetical protein
MLANLHQVAIGLGWWVFVKTDVSSSSHHLIRMTKDRQKGQMGIMEHTMPEQWRGKIYMLAQYRCKLGTICKAKH